MLAREQPLYRFSQIDENVEAVRNLDSRWRSSAGALSICTSPVSADDLDAALRCQPRGERFGGAVGQQVNRSTTLVVNQNRAVGPPPLPSPIVHAHDPR